MGDHVHRLQAARGAGLSVTSDPSSSRPSPRYEVPPPPPPRDRRHERAGAVEWTALAAVCIVAICADQLTKSIATRALERIEIGTYGTCASCQRPIAEARLSALPYANRCIDCKRLEERG